MQNARRVARELALKVLFQVDVGKQPLAEVLAGATAQIRTTIDSAVNQIAFEAQGAFKALAAERIEGLGDRISTQSSRQIKTIATAMSTELKALAVRSSEIVRELCESPSEGAADRATEQIQEAAEASRAAIHRLRSRESLYSQVLGDLEELALRKIEQAELLFAKHAPGVEIAAAFMLQLVHGATEKRDEIDSRLAERSTGWSLDRQAAVDRNILRLAGYEILFDKDIPAGVSINEAVELAKKYSTAESGRFVNGVLGALSGQH